MNKKVMKVIAILLLTLMVVFSLSQFALASEYPDATEFNGKDIGDSKTKISNFVGGLITVARYIGVGVAVLMLIVLAIKYISAAPSEKAEIKKSAVIYVTGAVLLFAASGILTVIQSFAETLNN